MRITENNVRKTTELLELRAKHQFQLAPGREGRLQLALDLTDGSIQDASVLLGVDRGTVYRWVRELGIELPNHRQAVLDATEAALLRNHGNVTKTASELGLPRITVAMRLSAHPEIAIKGKVAALRLQAAALGFELTPIVRQGPDITGPAAEYQENVNRDLSSSDE